MNILTTHQLKDMAPGTVFASGEIENSPEGVYMTSNKEDQNKIMRWAARRGEIDDWAIYIHWAYNSQEYVLDHGDKVSFKDHIKKLVPCDSEALARYRK